MGRRLVLVDIENIAGGACLSANAVRTVKSKVIDAANIGEADHVVIGTSHIGLLEVGCNWPGIRYVVRSGPDGADLALLEVLSENVPARYGEVVLASGDGIFADALSELESEGVPTTVIGRTGAVAGALKMAASRVVYVGGEPLGTAQRAIA
jgi:hypothetical protein